MNTTVNDDIFVNWDSVDSFWFKKRGRLVNKFHLWDFFRDYEGYSAERPLVWTKTGGFIGFVKVKGLDPEPFGSEVFDEAAAAVRRAFNNFTSDALDKDNRGGYWEVSNYFIRRRGSAPELIKPVVDNEALHFLWEKTRDFWKYKETFVDEICFTVYYNPKLLTQKEKIKYNSPEYHLELIFSKMSALARNFTNVMKSFIQDLNSFHTMKPELSIDADWMDENEVYKFLYQLINLCDNEPVAYDVNRPLLNQVCFTDRLNKKDGLYVGDQQCEVLTFKRFPEETKANLLEPILNNCQFPFTICQTIDTFDTTRFLSKVEGNIKIAGSLRAKRYIAEGEEFLDSVRDHNSVPMVWKFNCLVAGNSGMQLEDRVQKMKSYLKSLFNAEVMSENHAIRLMAELSTIPGNGFYNQRGVHITSDNMGQVACVYKRDSGSKEGHIIFGDRNKGVYCYDLFNDKLGSCNLAVLGGPGSGKSLMMNLQVIALAGYFHQIYVIDLGNSFGPSFEFLKEANPDAVSVMRMGEGQMRFHPFPLVTALKEKARQELAGVYRKELSDGYITPCPVEIVKDNFYAWIQVLLGGGQVFTPTQLNALNRALNGAEGKGGYFLHYMNQCNDYLSFGDGVDPPRPLTELKKFINSEAREFYDALDIWTRGQDAEYFDSGFDGIGSAKAVYFELTGLKEKPALIKPFVAALTMSTWPRIADPFCLNEQKLVVIDEAWSFLSDPVFEETIEKMFRTIRKFHGFVTLSTQSPKDVIDGNNVKLMQQMNRQLIYTGFSDDDYYKVQLNLSDHQIELHRGLQSDFSVHEVMLWERNGNTRVLDVVVDPYRYWFITSHPQDKVYRNVFSDHYGGLLKGIEHLVKACHGETVGSPTLRKKYIERYCAANKIPI